MQEQQKRLRELNHVYVKFEDPSFNYWSSVSAQTTEETAKEYFVGKMFNVSAYPVERYRKCIGIDFVDNNKIDASV